MESPLKVFDDEGFREFSRMGLEEAAKCLDKQFVEIGSPAFLDVGTGAGRQFRGQFGLDDGFVHDRLITQEMQRVKETIGRDAGQPQGDAEKVVAGGSCVNGGEVDLEEEVNRESGFARYAVTG